MTEKVQNTDFRRKPQIFADSSLLLEIEAFGGRRKPHKIADFRRKPKIFAENRRKLQIGLRHLRSVTFSSAQPTFGLGRSCSSSIDIAAGCRLDKAMVAIRNPSRGSCLTCSRSPTTSAKCSIRWSNRLAYTDLHSCAPRCRVKTWSQKQPFFESKLGPVFLCFLCFCCSKIFFFLQWEWDVHKNMSKKRRQKYHFIESKLGQNLLCNILGPSLTQPWTKFWLNLFGIWGPCSFYKRCWNHYIYCVFQQQLSFLSPPQNLRNTICEHSCANWFF